MLSCLISHVMFKILSALTTKKSPKLSISDHLCILIYHFDIRNDCCFTGYTGTSRIPDLLFLFEPIATLLDVWMFHNFISNVYWLSQRLLISGSQSSVILNFAFYYLLHISQCLTLWGYFIFVCLILMSQLVLYYLHSAWVLSFYIDVALALFIFTNLFSI